MEAGLYLIRAPQIIVSTSTNHHIFWRKLKLHHSCFYFPLNKILCPTQAIFLLRPKYQFNTTNLNSLNLLNKLTIFTHTHTQDFHMKFHAIKAPHTHLTWSYFVWSCTSYTLVKGLILKNFSQQKHVLKIYPITI